MSRTRLLMSASALLMGACGLAASFMPQELLLHSGAEPAPSTTLIVQLLGALYLGFAMLNWSARGNVIGGIYARPLALGNFLHATVAAIALVKVVLSGSGAPAITAAGVVYVVFAAAFGFVLFGPSPTQQRTPAS